MKYKVGDKVLIKEDLVPDSCYNGVYFAYGMTDFMGKVLTIKEKYEDLNDDWYGYYVEECDWVFSDGMIEGYADPYSCVKSYTMEELKEFITIPSKIEFSDSIPCRLLDSFKLYKKEKEMKDFKITNYNTYNNKVVTVTFEDGTQEKAVCNENDNFDLENGVNVCLMKHIFGADKYKSMIKDAMRQIKAIDKAEEAEKERVELIERKRAKAARKKARRKERERAERIYDMKTAYVAALKECGMDHNCECECECSCGTDWDELK